MLEEPTNTEYPVTTPTGSRQNQEIDASIVQDWKPGRKPCSMRGYSLAIGRRRTRAMLPARERSKISQKLNLPAWHKPYGEALLEGDPEILVNLLAATEIALFERLLELTANEDASDERHDLLRAVDVMLALKAAKTQAGSKILSAGLPGAGLRGVRDCVTALGGSFAILSGETGTTVQVVIPFPEAPTAGEQAPDVESLPS